MKDVPAIDATAANAIRIMLEESRKDGTQVIFAGINRHVFKAMVKTGLTDLVGTDNILADVPLALAQAVMIIEQKTAARKSL